MSRLMSVSKTERAVVERRKDVTRRLGWWEDKRGRRLLKPGDHLTLCRKVMGRKKGEPLVRLAQVEVVDVRRERLNQITAADVEREGVDLPPGFSGPVGWAAWFAGEMRCPVDTEITRIEWRYLDEQKATS